MTITLVIVIATVLVSLYVFSNPDLGSKLQHNPYQEVQHKQYYRMLTHGLVHANYAHLFVNMFVLYSFGGYVEDLFVFYFSSFGKPLFLFLYLGGMVFATLPSIQKQKQNPYYNAVGASGAVSAVLFAFIVMSPASKLALFLVVPMPAFVFGMLYVFYESRMQNKSDGVAHDAHLFGALYGALFVVVCRPYFVSEFFEKIFFLFR